MADQKAKDKQTADAHKAEDKQKVAAHKADDKHTADAHKADDKMKVIRFQNSDITFFSFTHIFKGGQAQGR
jgi:hypothetical protein